jgi:hypothetical protein
MAKAYAYGRPPCRVTRIGVARQRLWVYGVQGRVVVSATETNGGQAERWIPKAHTVTEGRRDLGCWDVGMLLGWYECHEDCVSEFVKSLRDARMGYKRANKQAQMLGA